MRAITFFLVLSSVLLAACSTQQEPKHYSRTQREEPQGQQKQQEQQEQKNSYVSPENYKLRVDWAHDYIDVVYSEDPSSYYYDRVLRKSANAEDDEQEKVDLLLNVINQMDWEEHFDWFARQIALEFDTYDLATILKYERINQGNRLREELASLGSSACEIGLKMLVKESESREIDTRNATLNKIRDVRLIVNHMTGGNLSTYVIRRTEQEAEVLEWSKYKLRDFVNVLMQIEWGVVLDQLCVQIAAGYSEEEIQRQLENLPSQAVLDIQDRLYPIETLLEERVTAALLMKMIIFEHGGLPQ